MAPSRERGQEDFREALPALLSERGISYRQFATAIGISQSYLSRTLNAERAPSMRILEGAAQELGFPKDYFPEYRERAVIDALKRDAAFRDSIYDSLPRKRR